ncbi:MAG: nitrous oxide reductase family maturation protein NosD [Candidatus Kapabacteria bacterium]|nr:nitrous oxide reductase family maturation protein NosD [Candidatus Kapabacteria bacterium]
MCATLICVFALYAYTATATTYRAYTSGKTTLRIVLATVADSDTVFVMPGVHVGSGFSIDKRITIIGMKGAIVDAHSKGETIFLVKADGVVFRNLTIRNVAVSYVDDHAAIKVLGRSGIDIAGCRIENGFFAIYLSRSINCRVSNNTILGTARDETSAGNGIHAFQCRNILVTGNTVYGHRDGIYFEFMRQGTVLHNRSERNARYGLHFMFSDSCSYKNNVFESNGAGVAVMFSHFVEMIANTFSNNWGPTSYGLLLKEIKDGHLKDNHFERNTVAIHAEGASRFLIEGNTFIRNGYGFRILGGCDEITVVRNTFDGNTFDVTTNSRESFNSFHGNYWSSYEGYDLNHDGVGDVPHHPVRLYSLLVEQLPSSVILMHTAFISMLDLAERIIPTVTPELLVDNKPLMRPIASR